MWKQIPGGNCWRNGDYGIVMYYAKRNGEWHQRFELWHLSEQLRCNFRSLDEAMAYQRSMSTDAASSADCASQT